MFDLFQVQENPFTGVLFHAVGGLAAASFYIPYKKVKAWSWEIYWMIGGFFSWIIAPWALAMLILPQTPQILAQASTSSLVWTFSFGLLWGVGGLTFGLTMRYLGIALGYSIALGISAVIGTLVPPLFEGKLLSIAATQSGQVMLLGVFICLAGIALGGKAGTNKQNELSDEDKKQSVSEFHFGKGLALALFSGVMSSFMAYAFAAGKPIADIAVAQGSPSLWQNLPVLIVILAGGFVTNFIWCAYLATKNKAWSQLSSATVHNPRLVNILFCALAGVTWYMQFFFYGMGTTMMGEYEFSSWTLHMASIIVFSTLWGLALKEWQGVSAATQRWNLAGLAVLILSMVVIGWGNTLAGSAAAH
ncbi:rhamnose-proton symporter [Catenovulum agarivorans DS-2]|uniref:Rhamnose-proton symporter n=1 Tax=Catenovulum agarivorans DS-2 TaxID=1328313 RepID=W7QF03_9ALTE|nr:L-rhamnose/proton symporter RhaT [Catenovulum agarivorans]EWH10506.1 rhamnose-proton symporter [Catenovulum agarivorans DS-2]